MRCFTRFEVFEVVCSFWCSVFDQTRELLTSSNFMCGSDPGDIKEVLSLNSKAKIHVKEEFWSFDRRVSDWLEDTMPSFPSPIEKYPVCGLDKFTSSPICADFSPQNRYLEQMGDPGFVAKVWPSEICSYAGECCDAHSCYTEADADGYCPVCGYVIPGSPADHERCGY